MRIAIKKKEFGNSDTLSSFHYLFARNSFAKGDKKTIWLDLLNILKYTWLMTTKIYIYLVQQNEGIVF